MLFPTLPSPQSLFYKTPEEITHLRVDPGQYTLEDYFHTDKAPMDEPTAPGLRNEMPKKRRPMLLLVEDNVINLQVRWGDYGLLHTTDTGINTDVDTASQHLRKKE